MSNKQQISNALTIIIFAFLIHQNQSQEVSRVNQEQIKGSRNHLASKVKPNLQSNESEKEAYLNFRALDVAFDPSSPVITGGWTQQSTCVQLLSINPFRLFSKAINILNNFNNNKSNGYSLVRLILTQVVAGQNGALIYELDLNGQTSYLGIRLFIPIFSNVPFLQGFAVSDDLESIFKSLALPSTKLNLSCSLKNFKKNSNKPPKIVGGWTVQTDCVDLFNQNAFNYIQNAISEINLIASGKANGQTTIKLIMSQVVAGFKVFYLYYMEDTNGNPNYLGLEVFQPLGQNIVPLVQRIAYNSDMNAILDMFKFSESTTLDLNCDNKDFGG